MSLLSFPKLLDNTAQFVGDAVSATIGTPYGQFIRGVAGSKDNVYGTEIFKDNEIDVLKDLAKEQVKQGSFQINYKDIGADITSKLSYNMKLPDKMSAKDAIATTLGTSSLRRDGDRLIIVDEYDFQKPKEEPKETSLYGMAHQVGEVLNPPGQGPSIRADLGSWKELGLDEKQFSRVPTLESYEKSIGKEDKPESWEGVAQWLSKSLDDII